MAVDPAKDYTVRVVQAHSECNRLPVEDTAEMVTISPITFQ